jgi:hypothetical protein
MALPGTIAPPAARDIFSGFVLFDWVFVLFAYLLLLYLLLQIELQIIQPGVFDFDFLPIVNGALIIPIGWGAVRLDRRMRDLIIKLDRGGVVVFRTAKERQAILAAVKARSSRYGWIGAAAVGVTMMAGILSYTELLPSGGIRWAQGMIVGATRRPTVSLIDAATMTIFCVPIATLAGRFLGKIVGNGLLLDTLHDLGHDLSSFTGGAGLQTIRTIEAIYAYSAMVTVVLTAVLCFWWGAFTLRLPGLVNYADWRYPYLWLWTLSFAAFLFAVVLPVRAFRRRLDEIHGGAEARAEVARQADEARQDARQLRGAINAAAPAERVRLERRLRDLEGFIVTLETRALRRPLLDQRFLYAWIVINFFAIVVPALLAGGA